MYSWNQRRDLDGPLTPKLRSCCGPRKSNTNGEWRIKQKCRISKMRGPLRVPQPYTFLRPCYTPALGSTKHPSILMVSWYSHVPFRKDRGSGGSSEDKIGLIHVPVQSTEVIPSFNWVLQSPLSGCWNCSALILLDFGLACSLVLLFSFLEMKKSFFPCLDFFSLLVFSTPAAPLLSR